VELAADLAAGALAEALPERPIRSYPALLSTEADALAWARSGAPEGAVVVADYQASPRGRAGWPWEVSPGTSLGFSLVLRPRLPAEREGWIYVVASSGLADGLGQGATIEWPDEVRMAGSRAGAVGVQVEPGPQGAQWAVVNVLVAKAAPPRAPLLARLVHAIETRYRSPAELVLSDYMPRCETIGRRVRARLVPLGPGGQEVTGRAAVARPDGSLVLEAERGRRVAVRPQSLGILEDADRDLGSGKAKPSRA
jgi:BirA family biotin operon repressor/biotin-[acetyl-CoA-carboxylase] ligase